MNFFVKKNDGRDKRLNFAIFVVWSINYVLAESLERKVSIPSFSFYRQSADCYSHVFSLIHPVNEFSLKEMRTWGQPMISSWCLCGRCYVWIKRIGGQGSPRFLTPMVESFSTDLLTATKSLLDRAAFRILSNINNHAPQWKYVKRF